MHRYYKWLDELAKVVYKTRMEFGRLPGIKPVFRLRPPSKGFKDKVKRSFSAGGITGYNDGNTNNLTKE